jgi:hypothetical protein
MSQFAIGGHFPDVEMLFVTYVLIPTVAILSLVLLFGLWHLRRPAPSQIHSSDHPTDHL